MRKQLLPFPSSSPFPTVCSVDLGLPGPTFICPLLVAVHLGALRQVQMWGTLENQLPPLVKHFYIRNCLSWMLVGTGSDRILMLRKIFRKNSSAWVWGRGSSFNEAVHVTMWAIKMETPQTGWLDQGLVHSCCSGVGKVKFTVRAGQHGSLQ